MERTELPGAELVEQGRRDLERGVESSEALLVSMAAERLRTLGIAVPAAFPDAQLRLYRKLSPMSSGTRRMPGITRWCGAS